MVDEWSYLFVGANPAFSYLIKLVIQLLTECKFYFPNLLHGEEGDRILEKGSEGKLYLVECV